MNSAIGERQMLPWQMNNTFIIFLYLHLSLVFLLKRLLYQWIYQDCREKHKKIREDLRRYLEKKGKLKSRKTLKNQALEKKYKT